MRVATGWEAFIGYFRSPLNEYNDKHNFKRKLRPKYLILQWIGCRQTPKHNVDESYFTAMAPTRDSRILKPSVPPNSGSLERSGCGIMPSTFRPGLQIPAMLSRDPLGLASAVISRRENSSETRSAGCGATRPGWLRRRS